LIEIKHKPKYKNGAYRKKYVSYKAQNMCNAMLKAVAYCQKNSIEVIGYDVVKPFPAGSKAMFNYLKEKLS
jgi:hypothetical protein